MQAAFAGHLQEATGADKKTLENNSENTYIIYILGSMFETHLILTRMKLASFA